MIRFWALGCLSVLALLARGASAAEQVLAENGTSAYVIAVPNGPDEHDRLKWAVDLLQSTLAEALGVTLRVVKEGDLQPGTPAIYLGHTQAAEKASLRLKDLKGWTFIKEAQGNDIFLAGRDSKYEVPGPYEGMKGSGFEYLGTLKAVTSFLEEEVGVRFLLPTRNGRYIPKLSRLTVKSDLKVFRSPLLAYVMARDAGDDVYQVANNFVATNSTRSYSGHSYDVAVPADKYGMTHPEYFALIGGVRKTRGNHVCISNQAVEDLVIQEVERQYDKGYESVEVNVADAHEPCECPKCVALHAAPGERLWIAYAKLAERIKRERPGKKVMLASYGPTGTAPRSLKELPDNVVIQLCGYQADDFDDWNRFPVEKTVYVYNWCKVGGAPGGIVGPQRTPRYAGEQVRLFAKNKVRGIYFCGGQELQGLEGPVYYVYGKMLGDPELHYAELANDFYRAAYGKARAPMAAFFNAMHDRLETSSAICLSTNTSFRTEPEPNYVFAATTPEDWFCHYFPPKLVANMQENLQRAKALAEQEDDPTALKRIRRVEFDFTYLKNLADIFTLYRAYRAQPTWATFDVLAAEIEKRNALLDAAFDEQGNFQAAFDGWPRFFGGMHKADMLVNGNYLGAPTMWNTKAMRAKNVLPGVSAKAMTVARAKGIKLTGRMDDPAWQGLKAEELSGVNLGELKNAARFKLAYDDQNFYAGFECSFQQLKKVEMQPLGRDGRCWRAECIELVLDPLAAREKCYHFVINPVPDSCYDARLGFITDPRHPLYRGEDKSWNGLWEYFPAIDKEKKKYTVEIKIPFRTLGVERPQSGTMWAANFGRENDGSDVGLWSPNLEDGGICSLRALGDLTFE